MAMLEDRIEKAIQQKAIIRANLDNFCKTFCKEELSSSSARAAEITMSLQTEKENTQITQTLSDQMVEEPSNIFILRIFN